MTADAVPYRPGPYHAEHARSRQGNDTRQRPGTLRALLRWAHAQYVAETPNLAHSGSHLDDDGAPTMAAQARRYLGMMTKDGRADNWLAIASKTDADGYYLTPLRRAIETLPTERRLFLRDLVPELFFPSEIALLHGIPEWCRTDVTYQSLVLLWARYIDRPLPQPGWLQRSESQRSAEQVA